MRFLTFSDYHEHTSPIFNSSKATRYYQIQYLKPYLFLL